MPPIERRVGGFCTLQLIKATPVPAQRPTKLELTFNVYANHDRAYQKLRQAGNSLQRVRFVSVNQHEHQVTIYIAMPRTKKELIDAVDDYTDAIDALVHGRKGNPRLTRL